MPQEPSSRPPVAAIGAAAALATLFLFRDAAFGGRLPHATVGSDDVAFVGTVLGQAGAQVRAGAAPLWFPEFDCGTPLAAAWMYGLLYPGLLLFAFLPLGTAWALTAALHAGIGASGMAAFLRRRGCGVAAAAAGALLFALSEHFVGRTACGHLNLVLPLAWVPWILRFADGCVRGEPRAPALLALVGAAGLLSGHVQTWIYLGPLVAAFAAAEALGCADRGAAARRLAVGAGLTLAIAAAQIAITGEFVALAAPAAYDPGMVEAGSVPPSVLLVKGLLSWSGPAPGADDVDLRHEFLGVAGIWTFGLAAWGFVRRAPRRGFWCAAAVAGLVVSLGTRTAATAWIQDLPPFSLARAPGRALVVPLVAVPILAAHGVQAIAWGRAPGAARAVVAAAAVALAFLLGTPAVESIPDAMYRTDWRTWIPEDLRAHRVHSPPLYQWTNLEASGVRTLRTPCYVQVAGYAELTRRPTPAVAYWLDLGASLRPEVRGSAGAVPRAEDLVRVVADRHDAVGTARFFGDARFGVAPDETLRRLEGGERALYLDGDAVPGGAAAAAGTGTATLAARSPDEVRVEVAATGPGWLLVSEKAYPGWTCTIDGAAADVRRANLAFSAVRIPAAGTRSVVLRYEPLSFRIGAAVSLAALAWTLVLLLRSRRVVSAG